MKDFSFSDFLVEMETSPDEKERIRIIIQKLIENDDKWFDKQNIYVGDKGRYWVLNYLPVASNEYNRLVRGMIVRKPVGTVTDVLQLIHSFPFIRFFNQHESEAAKVNLANAEMLEKLDGTFVGVYFPDKNPKSPEWHTRKMVSTYDKDMNLKVRSFTGKQYDFMPLIGKYVKKLNFSKEDINYTFMFEFVHEASAVVTKYDEEHYGLYLLAARNLDTHREMDENQLDEEAKRIGAKRPKRWHTTGSKEEVDQIMQAAKQMRPDFEGFVFRDKETGKRVKVKDLDYLRKHRMIGNTRSVSTFLPLILMGEESEILAYFPQFKVVVDAIKKAYSDYVDKAVTRIMGWKSKNLTRKELANQMLQKGLEPDRFIASRTFRLFDEENDKELIRRDTDNELRRIALGGEKSDGSPKKLLDVIGLKDQIINKEDTGEI